jgi:hypothetical protein
MSAAVATQIVAHIVADDLPPPRCVGPRRTAPHVLFAPVPVAFRRSALAVGIPEEGSPVLDPPGEIGRIRTGALGFRLPGPGPDRDA